MSDSGYEWLVEWRVRWALHAVHGSAAIAYWTICDANLAKQLTHAHARSTLRAQILAHHLAD